MKQILCTLSFFAFIAFSSYFSQASANITISAKMQQSSDVQMATSSEKQSMASAFGTVEEKWTNWLSRHNGMTEGWNPRNDPRKIIISSQAVIRAKPNDRKWVVARNAAFNMAELSAKQKLAEIISIAITTGRFAELAQQGGEAPPPMFKAPLKKLSIADKTRVLAEKSIDEAIKYFDAQWNGTGMNEKEKQAKLITLQEKFSRKISARARLFNSGAFVITNFEGLNEDGNYSMLVGIIWSMKLAKIAESIFNPEVVLEPVAPKTSILDQLSKLEQSDPDFFCYANGVRVWTNENGERVIISFGSVPATSSIMIDKDRATLVARSGIQTFVAELVETQATINDDFTYQETAEENQTFNNESFQRRIDAKAKTIRLQGATPIKSWRGKHPTGQQRLQVVAVIWSPQTCAASRILGNQLNLQEDRMKHQGGAIKSHQKSQSGTESSVVVPVKQGPSSDPTDF